MVSAQSRVPDSREVQKAGKQEGAGRGDPAAAPRLLGSGFLTTGPILWSPLRTPPGGDAET